MTDTLVKRLQDFTVLAPRQQSRDEADALMVEAAEYILKLEAEGFEMAGLDARAEDRAEVELLRSLLVQHRCMSDGAMTVGECVLTRRCGCSCMGQFPPHQAEKPRPIVGHDEFTGPIYGAKP